ncbi:mannitol dehydrogenase family protein [Nocardia flavorosea]|uniref:Mannitol-1-phosphate 5-dehydrogenase n=1 Tax=Nocardia flavorosea TaxID=53429 RepID=A0A846YKU3_9NOCA|nr:mannitol dehydrogenase family protein [Nocardia flavorosea]NKY58381.1 mannitol dehydrogenase family protein [Nocardia flavorosea]
MTVGPTPVPFARDNRPAPPVRMIHLGLGNFFRAHQAWYTAHAADSGEWGIAAFTGRSPAVAETLSAQDGLYTLVTRAHERDEFETVRALSHTYPASDTESWLGLFATSQVAVVTLTVTEAGYLRGEDGGLDHQDLAVAADIAALRADVRAGCSTAVGRLVAGLAARRAAGAGPIALVPCDNLPGNGAVLARLVREFAELTQPSLTRWIDSHVCFVTSAVDRITPATTPDDSALVERTLGYRDAAPVVTEPFREWVLCGDFPAGRPGWESSGAVFTSDVTPYENRKLWLLNGAHSLLAYTAPLRGHRTVASAVRDQVCRTWLDLWWREAEPHTGLPGADLGAYRRALLERFANPRIRHRLEQIAMDGSKKLPVRILPVLHRERTAGRIPEGAVRAIAGWVCHLTGHGVPVSDPGAAGVHDIDSALARLDPSLGVDVPLRAAILNEMHRLRNG